MFNFETKEELLKFLSEDEKGKEISEEIKQPLVKKRDEILSELKTAKSRLSEVPEDLDDIKARAGKVNQYETKLAELQKQLDSSNPDEKLEQLRQSYEEKIGQLSEKHNKFVNNYKETKVSSQITEAIRKFKGEPELLEHVVRRRIKESVDDNGNIVIETLSQDGKPYFLDGKEATVEDIVRELKNDERYGKAFEAEGKSGTGGRGNSGMADSTEIVTDPTKEGFSFSKLQQHMKRTGTGS